MAKRSVSKGKNAPPAGAVFTTRAAFEPEELDIGYALETVIGHLEGASDGRRVTLNYIFNPGANPQEHRREDRTERILQGLQRIRREWETLPATHAEAILIRASDLVNEQVGADDPAKEVVKFMIAERKLFAAIRKQVENRDKGAEKPLGDLPLTSLKSNGTAQALIESRTPASPAVSPPEGTPTEVSGSLVGA